MDGSDEMILVIRVSYKIWCQNELNNPFHSIRTAYPSERYLLLTFSYQEWSLMFFVHQVVLIWVEQW